MGSLHEGHLALVRAAKKRNDVVVVSIYVNPTQFGESDDLDVYPSALESDVKLLNVIGVDVVYAPLGTLYDTSHQTWVVPDIDGKYDEGSSRPGFFRGVATVVTKLLQQVQPDVVYFGQKDAQQCAVIQDLVRDLDIGVMTGENGMQIEIVPTVREHDGLAMSSRNAYLSEEERRLAPGLYQALRAGSEVLGGSEVVTVGEIRSRIMDMMEKNGICNVEYVTVADVRTTAPMSNDQECDGGGGGGRLMIATAARVGTTRLIDNIVV
jgi:pantoate--beta-alanine ligase